MLIIESLTVLDYIHSSTVIGCLYCRSPAVCDALEHTHTHSQLHVQKVTPPSPPTENKSCSTHIQSGHKTHSVLPLPKWVLILMYLAVPVKLLCSRYWMCLPLSGSMNSLARPKSMMWTMSLFGVPYRPMRKFSGFTSR